MNNWAVSTWIFRDLPLQRSLALLASSGFERVELSGSGSALLSAWEEDCRAVMNRLQAMNIAAKSVHCSRDGRIALDSPDESARRASIEVNMSCFERMRQCGVSEFILHPGGEDGTSAEDTVARRRLAREAVRILADRAGKMGLRLSLENAQKDSGPGASIAGLLELMAGTGEHVGLCHDVGHSALAGLDPVAETRAALASGRLFSLHLHDVAGEKNDHIPPGEGMLELDKLLDELGRSGFAGQLTVELRPGGNDEDIAARLARAAAAMNTREATGSLKGGSFPA